MPATRPLLAFILTLSASAAVGAGAHAPPPRGASPAFYAVSTSDQMKVVVDVDAQKQADGTIALPLFLFYAAPVAGHDIWADYLRFDCAAGTAQVQKTVGVSKYVEPLDMADTGDAPYRVPAGSMMSRVMAVACHGRRAIPPGWVALPMNLRQISVRYYRGYLKQSF